MAQKDRSNKVRLPVDFAQLYAVESNRFVLWLPVCMGIGIAAYFWLPREPSWHLGLLWLIPALCLTLGWARRVGWGGLVVCWALTAIALGFGLSILSARMADAPVIQYPIGETVEGRVLSLSRSASGAPRILLDRLVIYGLEPGETPARVRLTLLDSVPDPLPYPGQRVRVYASLMPTGEPVEPGGFDFTRRAFFERLGGVGLSRGHLLVLPSTGSSGLWDPARIWLARIRDGVSRHLREVLPGREGAFAAAIIVGDRADIDETDQEALRASNLAHLLAISGLHMGILTGLIFALSRYALALHPGIALCWPTRKIAAVIALSAGLAYLGLSGATIATQRAFIMAAVAFTAVLLDRPAITLRGLALAAAIVLAIRPVSVLDAGFQMSFAATAALVAGFEVLRRHRPIEPKRGGTWYRILLRAVAIYFGALIISSLLAGLATAPFAAFHFNRTAPYGLLANLLAVPIMGLWIAPWACLAAFLALFGWSHIALKAMGWGIELVLSVAHWVAALPGAVKAVGAAPPLVLGVIAFSGVWLVLWQGRWRLAGAVGIAAGFFLWSTAPPRPDLLVAPEGRLLGVMTAKGRALDHDRAQSFAAKTWLRRDGDLASQERAAERAEFVRIKGGLGSALPHGWRLEARWSNKTTAADLRPLCQPHTVLVAREGPSLEGPCLYLGKSDLSAGGAVAITITPEGPRVQSARDPGRDRLWTRQ